MMPPKHFSITLLLNLHGPSYLNPSNLLYVNAQTFIYDLFTTNYFNKLFMTYGTKTINTISIPLKKNTIHLECTICLESRPIDGANHTSTLLCGHHFCSQCIFKHIHTRGDNASCPMCRSHIFHTTNTIPIQTQQTTNPIIPNNRIQIRRQHERWTKRQRKRLNQTTLS